MLDIRMHKNYNGGYDFDLNADDLGFPDDAGNIQIAFNLSLGEAVSELNRLKKHISNLVMYLVNKKEGE